MASKTKNTGKSTRQAVIAQPEHPSALKPVEPEIAPPGFMLHVFATVMQFLKWLTGVRA